MLAVLEGSSLRPVVTLTFTVDARHATTGGLLRDWVKTLPQARWDPDAKRWTVNELGLHADRVLAQAGFDLINRYGDQDTCAGLIRPLAVRRPDDPDRLWELYPRLGGKDQVVEHLPLETPWQTSRGCWVLRADQFLTADGGVVPWVDIDDSVLAEARALPAVDVRQLRYDHTLDGLRGVPLTDLYSVSAVTAESMHAAGIGSVFDLLHHLPLRYLDLTNPTTIAEAKVGEKVALILKVGKVTKPAERTGMLKATLADSDGRRLSARWFNASYLAKKLVVGSNVVLFGKLELFQGSGGAVIASMTSPLIETVSGDQAGKILGIYRRRARTT